MCEAIYTRTTEVPFCSKHLWHGWISFCFSTEIWWKNANKTHHAAVILCSMKSPELTLPRNRISDFPAAKLGTSLEIVMSEPWLSFCDDRWTVCSSSSKKKKKTPRGNHFTCPPEIIRKIISASLAPIQAYLSFEGLLKPLNIGCRGLKRNVLAQFAGSTIVKFIFTPTLY